MAPIAVATLLTLLTAGAGAHAPRITPSGDPSVRADSIYSLAVKPEDFPGNDAAMLLDDGVVRLEADGKGSRTYRQVVQILRPEAVKRYQEQEFSYAPKHERFTLNWIRVVKPDGTVISEKPSQLQESDVPAQMGDPVYSDRKVLRASITGVAVGTIVDLSYTTEELKPFLAGDLFLSWNVNTGLAVKRSRYVVDIPGTVHLRLHETNLNFRRRDTAANGRHTMVWAAHDVPTYKVEAFAADSNDVMMSVQLALPKTWADIGKWYASNAKSRYVTTPAVDAKLTEVLSPAKTLNDSIARIHGWVAQDIRYESIALGLGGYQPRSPADVVSSGFGDCKDKATLFVAVMRRIGVTAYPVILNSTGGVQRDLPSIAQLDHVIAAFTRPGRTDREYVDLTAGDAPLGTLPFGEQGAFGVVVHADGGIEEVSLPLSRQSANRTEVHIAGTLAPDGTFEGQYELSAFGNRQYELRSAFWNPIDSTQRAQVANTIASGLFAGAEGDSLVGFNGSDLRAIARIRLRIHHGKAASPAGSNSILKNPLPTMDQMAGLAKEIESEPTRLFPIDPKKIFGYGESVTEVLITLPDGWRAQLPRIVNAAGHFGTYRTECFQEDNRLVIRRLTVGAYEVRAPDQVAELVAWLREIARDDASLIVLEKGTKER